MKVRAAAFAVLLCCPVLGAQEIRYIDLTALEQRTELRYPPGPKLAPSQGITGGGSVTVGGIIGEGAPDIRDPHALGVYLTHRTATKIDPTQPFQVEFKVVNTGTAPIAIPVSPNLSDLQPADDSVPFQYLSLALAVSVVGDPRSSAYVEIYGTWRHDETVVTLQPGEWIRVTANVKLRALPASTDTAMLAGSFWLRENTYYPHPGGHFTDMGGSSPNLTQTPPLKVFWLGATATP